MICEWCGKEFEEWDAAQIFEIEMRIFSYDNVQKCLCGECAISAIEEEVDDVYFEKCEECGIEFDYIDDSARFRDNFSSYSGTVLSDYRDNKILCCDCALKKV